VKRGKTSDRNLKVQHIQTQLKMLKAELSMVVVVVVMMMI